MDVRVWLIIFVLLVAVELATMALTTVWFAAGAMAALVSSMFGAPLWLQIIVFLAFSFIVLIFYRPFAVKYVNSKRTRTNVNDLIGKEGKVTEDINNLDQKGRMLLRGMDWSARTADDNVYIKKGTVVKVIKIEGVKAIVEPIENANDISQAV